MAVIFAVVGGGAVVGIASSGGSYDDYSNYSNYSNYDNYSNYSDAAERRRRRREEKTREIDNKKYEINSYKTSNVNEHLQTNSLKKQSGVDVSLSSIQKDGDSKIQKVEKLSINKESSQVQLEIDEINKVINKIDKILQEGE